MADKPSPAQMIRRVIAVAQLLVNAAQEPKKSRPAADPAAKNTKRKT
jgi:hypothetical protein